jgi:hypothetical protein
MHGSRNLFFLEGNNFCHRWAQINTDKSNVIPPTKHFFKRQIYFQKSVFHLCPSVAEKENSCCALAFASAQIKLRARWLI